MKYLLLRTLLLVALFIPGINSYCASGSPRVFTSSNTQATLIELFTSEGCSSCPPADRWLSHWKNDPRLWKQVLPLAFHVDYWNYLGWTDRFARPQYSARQRLYATRGYAHSVYTPGLFLNGREWRGWFNNRNLNPSSNLRVGTLSVTLGPQQLTATFEPAQAVEYPLLLNIAVVGLDIRSSITNGENRGKVLNHDFVVLKWQAAEEKSALHWQITNNDLGLSQPLARAVVFWVTTKQDPTPIQATGGWLVKD